MLETVTLKTMTQQDLAALGIGEIAYLRPANVQGEELIAVMAADGRQIGMAPDRETAAHAALQHELVLVPLH
jgi:hypothetical protein